MGLISLLIGGVMDANKAIKQNKAKGDVPKEVVVNNKFSINVPTFLSPTNLNEDASLQYASKTLDISFMVIDEPKSEFIDAVSDLQLNNAQRENDTLLDAMATLTINNMFDMDKVKISNYTATTINGLNAITLNIFQSRTFFKDAVYGSFAFVEGKNTLYQILIMSGGTSIRELAEVLEKSIYSFKEL